MIAVLDFLVTSMDYSEGRGRLKKKKKKKVLGKHAAVS